MVSGHARSHYPISAHWCHNSTVGGCGLGTRVRTYTFIRMRIIHILSVYRPCMGFVSGFVVICLTAAAAQAQQQTILTPLSYTAFLDPSDVSVRFTCTGEGVHSLWRVDGQIASDFVIKDRGIYTASIGEGGNFTSQIIIPATVENNNTEVQCSALSDAVDQSEIATFRIQGG